MGYHPRIENGELSNLVTTRCRNSELWFVNNEELTNDILGYLAKFKDRYEAKVYAFAIEGNHIHISAQFEKNNRSCFMRDLNSCIARAVPRHISHYPGGRLFARRYSAEYTPGVDDIKEYFFYTVLQSVNDGFVEDIRDYPDYNCFWDAINGKERIYEVVDWARYNAEKRWKKSIHIKNYTYEVVLKYDRLPGYEDLTQEEYKEAMLKELEERQQEIKDRRRALGKVSVAGVSYLKSVKPGTRPHKTKVSTRDSHRPRVLSICDQRRTECKAWYFEIQIIYKKSSEEYRKGNREIIFPTGTYPPPLTCVI